MKRLFSLLMLFAGFVALSAPLSIDLWTQKPRLVVVLVVDQLRSDQLIRYASRFLPARSGGKLGGFKYLMQEGAYYPFAEYQHLQNMTGPGHATILSGSHPYQHGIAMNQWYEPVQKKDVYCVEDQNSPTLGVSDPKSAAGKSPRNFRGSTVGDELKNSGARSKVVSLALKDRAAILMGGFRADAVFWMDTKSMDWVSSRFYFSNGKLPEWLVNWNQSQKKKDSWTWKVDRAGVPEMLDETPYQLEHDLLGAIAPTFPHTIARGKKVALTSPLGTDFTLEFAEKLIEQYELGKDSATDLLTLSFSSHDYVGHTFGPNSREIEEMTVAEDKRISRFLNFLVQKIPGGMKDITVVLTSDHGIAPNPDWLNAHRVPAGRIDEAKLVEAIGKAAGEKLGKKPSEVISAQWEMNFYLADEVTKTPEQRTAAEEAVKAAILSTSDAFAFAFTKSDWKNGRLPAGLLGEQIRHTYFEGRSGDVVGVLKPFYFAADSKVTHMTSYSYDRMVPIIMAGRRFKPGVYAEQAAVTDIAPTLSFILGVIAPALSEGRVLSQSLR